MFYINILYTSYNMSEKLLLMCILLISLIIYQLRKPKIIENLTVEEVSSLSEKNKNNLDYLLSQCTGFALIPNNNDQMETMEHIYNNNKKLMEVDIPESKKQICCDDDDTRDICQLDLG